MCVSVYERECVRENVCVSVRERVCVCICVYLCVCMGGGREREIRREGVRLFF